MKLSEKITKIKESVMLGIHNNKVPISLKELSQHNKNIDNMIEEVKKAEKKKNDKPTKNNS